MSKSENDKGPGPDKIPGPVQSPKAENPFGKAFLEKTQSPLVRGRTLSSWLTPDYDPARPTGHRGLASLEGIDLSKNLFGMLPPLESPEQAKVREERDDYRTQLQQALKTSNDSQKLVEEYRAKERLSYLLARLDSSVHKRVLADKKFADQFDDGARHDSYVISIDIRRSTDLMLKAKSPEAFARFISQVSSILSAIMKEDRCVFDKFTGDGMLGFFPRFYSGDDFGLCALRVALKCHKAFAEIYDASKPLFDTVLRDVGLGIGIDFGEVQLMRVSDGLTVVGRPVVYACRLSGAPAGKTYLNQSARTQLLESHPHSMKFEWRDFEAKNEGWITVSELVDLTEE